MKFESTPNYDELSRRAARIIARMLIRKPDSVLGLPTGQTPTKMYRYLTQFGQQGLVPFQSVVTFNLDEYYPIQPDDPKSFHYYMQKHLIQKISITTDQVHVPEGTATNEEALQRRCKQYEQAIHDHNGIDLQVLGIGENGHIGFNEPGSDFDSETRPVELSDHTIDANFEDRANPPRRAITMGLKTIMHADRILLLASGKRKATAIANCIGGEVSKDNPASILQLHPSVTILADTEAASQVRA